jgi:lysophospholipase L1-like esterase
MPSLVKRYDDFVGLWDADVLILQVGIVDCAPRVFGPRQHALLSSRLVPGFVRDLIIRTASRYRRQIIELRPRVRYTQPGAFERALAELGTRLSDRVSRVLVIPVLGPTDDHEKRSPGCRASVALCNDTWRRWCVSEQRTYLEYSDAFGESSLEDVVAGDGYHLSPAGNQKLAESLVAILTHQASV